MIDVIHEEATEDMYRLAGLSEDDRVFSPVDASMRKRLPWMLINLATAFLAASVVGLFRAVDRAGGGARGLHAGGGRDGRQRRHPGADGHHARRRPRGARSSTGLRAVVKGGRGSGSRIGAPRGADRAGSRTGGRDQPMIGVVLFLAMVVNMAIAGLLGRRRPAGC